MSKWNLTGYALVCVLVALIGCKKKDQEASPTASPTEQTTAVLTASATATDKTGNTYEVGFTNPSGNNKNPFVVKKDASGNQVWKVVHETSGVDGTATLVTLDANQNPWVVFTVDGGSGDNTYITRSQVETDAFNGVLFNNYGNGGGPKIAVIAQLNPQSGKIVKGTFLMCRRDKVSNSAGPQYSGKSINDPNTVTNSITINKIGVSGTEVTVEASNTFRPPALGSTQGSFIYYPNYDQAGTGKIRYSFPLNLSKINSVSIIPN